MAFNRERVLHRALGQHWQFPMEDFSILWKRLDKRKIMDRIEYLIIAVICIAIAYIAVKGFAF